jgi:acetyl-CoA/propionyl-CoA carboxylase biotin carboxyl carrier protein
MSERRRIGKILIANRGEIAVRVIRACRELGVATVAVFSEADREALHVRMADEAYAIGPPEPAQSYLAADRLVQVAKASGADAVHPGYGFLSENPGFAEACAAAGLVFIGPPPAAMRAMSDKTAARRSAMALGVPVVPGTADPVSDDAEALRVAREVGYPVMIKAAMGGGGKGMRVVRDEREMAAALRMARAEAGAAFADSSVYVERHLGAPRHIEIQVLADAHGAVVHLGERECSIQRRHQKLIEEAPSPLVDPAMRARMGEAACRLASAAGYVNAGTVEFLYQDGEFYYLEMNTRLQVEHPVTEMVTGIDLVAEQIRVAAGEALSFGQDDISPRGHAIECRINAENPSGGRFLPAPGRITQLDPPQGFGTRWDGGYEAGDEVSQFYDNLVGKLIVWGVDRETAIARTRRALDELRIEGIVTTAPAQRLMMDDPDFVAGEHSTKWVEEKLDLSGLEVSTGAPAADDAAEPRIRRDIPVEVNGKRFSVTLWLPEAPVAAAAAGSTAGRPRARRTTSATSAVGGTGAIAVPMQGTIVKVLVEVGDAVETGQGVVVLEAMKMENQVLAERDGTVTAVGVAGGDPVGPGDLLVEMA